jgi:hypothetical protein
VWVLQRALAAKEYNLKVLAFGVFVVFKHHFGDLLELKAVWRLPLKLVFHFSQPGPDYLFRHRQIQKHQRFVKNVSI